MVIFYVSESWWDFEVLEATFILGFMESTILMTYSKLSCHLVKTAILKIRLERDCCWLTEIGREYWLLGLPFPLLIHFLSISFPKLY